MTYRFEIILFFKEKTYACKKNITIVYCSFFKDFTFKENMYAETIIV